MPGSARERLRNIMMATQHGTRSPDHVQIELLQLVAELLIEIKQDLKESRPMATAATAPANGHDPHMSIHPGAFGL